MNPNFQSSWHYQDVSLSIQIHDQNLKSKLVSKPKSKSKLRSVSQIKFQALGYKYPEDFFELTQFCVSIEGKAWYVVNMCSEA